MDKQKRLHDLIQEVLGKEDVIIFVPRRIGTSTLMKETAKEDKEIRYYETGATWDEYHEILVKNGYHCIVACGGKKFPPGYDNYKVRSICAVL